ncbi:unnamed protein product, partial [Mesorhabditis spiculigera]
MAKSPPGYDEIGGLGWNFENMAIRISAATGSAAGIWVIQARRQEEPRTVGVIAFNDSCPYQAHEPRERLTRRAKIFWTFLILMCIALLVIPIIIIAHQNG